MLCMLLLTLLQLDEAENAASDMLCVKPKNSLPCGVLVYSHSAERSEKGMCENPPEVMPNPIIVKHQLGKVNFLPAIVFQHCKVRPFLFVGLR